MAPARRGDRERQRRRREWSGDWCGWWGDEPPYHAPVFVLTHHEREPIEMDGGTTFHFVTTGFEDAYAQARAVAGDKGVDIARNETTAKARLELVEVLPSPNATHVRYSVSA